MKFRGVCLFSMALPFALAGDLRLGIIGTDTSHVTAFTHVLNDGNAPNHVAGARVVGAYKGGSPDLEESAKKVDQYASELKEKWGVQFVSSIGDLCPLVDGILLESVDGRPHLAQFREAVRCGKPVFIDKPLASTLADAFAIARLARDSHVPWFSASALRFSPIAEMRSAQVISAIVWAPAPMEPHHQLDLSWYGIHAVEMLYTLFGTGCVEVERMSSANDDVITGRWKDGRLGTVHTQRPYGKYGGVVFLADRTLEARPDIPIDYVPLVQQIVKFMQTGTPAVANEETLEIFEFMDAAQRSVEQGGSVAKLGQP
ncbi:MAG TPA: Gfo/Idh/MocA family oxidoreductase [Bryobacteraceae bacterium]|nr:Gfo/Idh/MocA family oxidoreductase [Bryobacteraceae bacterium]